MKGAGTLTVTALDGTVLWTEAYAGDPMERVREILDNDEEIRRHPVHTQDGASGALYSSLRGKRHVFVQHNRNWTIQDAVQFLKEHTS